MKIYLLCYILEISVDCGLKSIEIARDDYDDDELHDDVVKIVDLNNR